MVSGIILLQLKKKKLLYLCNNHGKGGNNIEQVGILMGGKSTVKIKNVLSQLNNRILEQLFKGNAWHNGNLEEIACSFIKRIPNLWEKLSPEERKVLIYFLFRVPGQSIPYRQLDVLAKSHSPYAIYRGLTGLRQKGIIYTHKYQWGEMAFFIPEDVAYGFRQLHWNTYFCHGQAIPFIKGEEEFPSLCDVLFLILQTYRHHPISITKKGELPAKIRRFWEEMIPYPEELFVPLRCGKVEWFLTFLKEQGLMAPYEKKEEKLFRVQEEQVANLFQGNKGQVQRRLYEGIKRKYTESYPFFLVIFEALKNNQWKATWENILQEAGIEPLGNEWEDYSQQVLPLLQAFGLVQEEGNPGWIEKEGYVQPTFEVLLLPNASFEIRWGIGNYSRLIEQQELWTFQLDKETITLVQGPDREETLHSLLMKIQQGPLPENVVKQIHKWIEATEEVMIEKANLLRCSSKTLADRISSARMNGLGERINETMFLVPDSSLALLQKELNKIEIQLKENNVQERMPLPPKHGEMKEDLYVESVYPLLEDVLPEVKEIPSLWRKNRQKYHASTLRIFMEKASTLGLPVHMETCGKKWEGIYISCLFQEQGLDIICFTDGEKEYRVPLLEIGPIQMQI